MRLTKEELEKVKSKYGVDRLYSWSKVNTFMTSPYSYFLSYVLNKTPDNCNCAYAPLGNICHQAIEDFYSGKIPFEKMLDDFKDGWLTSIDIVNLKFDRNNEESDSNIKTKYEQNLIHFFQNHNVIERKIELERFLAAKIGNYVLQGYADAIIKDEDGNFVIIDWKTSSKYSGKTLEEHSGQLTIYAIALMQMGVPIEKIKCCFNFLKYCTIEYTQANGKTRTRDVERCKIGESLQSNLKVWLKKLGYEENIDDYLKIALDENSIKNLPKDIQEKYKISDCYTYIPLTQKLVDDWVHLISSTIKDIECRESDYLATGNENIFWDSEEQIKTQSYFHATLSEFSANLHKPYKAYLEVMESQKNGDIFSAGYGEVQSNSNVEKHSIEVDVDLSWLNDI